MRRAPVVDDIGLALLPQLAGGFDGGLGAQLLELLVAHDIRADEAPLKVAVDCARGLRSGSTVRHTARLSKYNAGRPNLEEMRSYTLATALRIGGNMAVSTAGCRAADVRGLGSHLGGLGSLTNLPALDLILASGEEIYEVHLRNKQQLRPNQGDEQRNEGTCARTWQVCTAIQCVFRRQKDENQRASQPQDITATEEETHAPLGSRS